MTNHKYIKQYPKYYLVTRYTPQIMTKINGEKPSAASLIWNFVKSGNTNGILIMSEKQMAKTLHMSVTTIYSDIKYLAKNGYIAIGSTGGSTNVFMLNPSIFWFKDAAYNKRDLKIFPSAVSLGRNNNYKFYKRVKDFYNTAQNNLKKGPIFADNVKKITRDKKNHTIVMHMGQNLAPVNRALYHVMYLHLRNKSLNIVKFLFSKMGQSDLDLYSATNKDIYKGLRKSNIKVSLRTVDRTMAKLSKNNIIVRSNGSKLITFNPHFYKEFKANDKQSEYFRQHDLIKQRKLDKRNRNKNREIANKLKYEPKL